MFSPSPNANFSSSHQKYSTRSRETHVCVICTVMAGCASTKACIDERVQDISLGSFDKPHELFFRFLYHPTLNTCLQNPDKPDKKPSLQTYQLDLNQTGPMVCLGSLPLSETLASLQIIQSLFICFIIGPRCSYQDKERSGPHSYLSSFLP